MTVHRMTAADFQKATQRPTGRNKYNAKKVTLDGFTFDSQREANRYCQLRLLSKAGKNRDLKLQVPIMLEGKDGPIMTPKGRQRRYVADFVYVDAETGLRVIEDAKGKPTEGYQLKRDILAAMGLEIVEV